MGEKAGGLLTLSVPTPEGLLEGLRVLRCCVQQEQPFSLWVSTDEWALDFLKTVQHLTDQRELKVGAARATNHSLPSPELRAFSWALGPGGCTN